jgi:hypothetical protein
MNPLKAIRGVGCALALMGAIGCGQKGPLVLPDHTGAVVTRPGGGAPQNTPAQPPAQPAQAPQSTTPPGTTSDAKKKDSDDNATPK